MFNRNGQPVTEADLQTMLSASPHRAVDGQDAWSGGHVALAHQHFWLTPEEFGEKQPIGGGDGRWKITCDARLDNRMELVRQLRLNPDESRHRSDSEIILLSYAKWGADCVRYLLGDFAFAIWDAAEQHLFLARDPLGARDLCLHLDANVCLVASEVEQIASHPHVILRMNEGRVAEFMANIWHNQEESFIEGVDYFPPAQAMIVTADTARRWHYWDLDPGVKVRYRDDREYGEHFRELFSESVRCRLRATGPMAISLSGGLDSTSVAAVAASALPAGQLKSISYVFDELTTCDERRYSKPLIERYQIEATYILADDKWPLRDLPRWPLYRDYVWSNAYIWAALSVLEEAREQGIRHLLTGAYGDNLFLGAVYWAADALRELRWGQLIGTWRDNRSLVDVRRDFFMNGAVQWLPISWADAYRRFRSRPLAGLNPGLHPDFVARTQLEERERGDPKRKSFSSVGQLQRYRSLVSAMIPSGDGQIRRLSNALGVEFVTPFYDRRLIEYAVSVPADQLGRSGWNKWMLRKAMADLLPAEILNRQTCTTFTPLFRKGFHDKERPAVESILSDPEIVRGRYVREEWLRRELRSGPQQNDSMYFVWLWLSLELWLKRFW
jgi:asparagine synthase (glutamine-hydrolysing)